MSKHKNFTINRTNVEDDNTIKAANFKIGDVFEKDGSLHMRVNFCNESEPPGCACICNLNTGSVWHIDETKIVNVVTDVTMNYKVFL